MPALPHPVCLRERIPALLHPVCLVAALADSPFAWSRRVLGLSNTALTSNGLLGVTWPETLG